MTRVFIVKIEFSANALTNYFCVKLYLFKAGLSEQNLVGLDWRGIEAFLAACLFVLWDDTSVLLELLQVWVRLVETSDCFHK